MLASWMQAGRAQQRWRAGRGWRCRPAGAEQRARCLAGPSRVEARSVPACVYLGCCVHGSAQRGKQGRGAWPARPSPPSQSNSLSAPRLCCCNTDKALKDLRERGTLRELHACPACSTTCPLGLDKSAAAFPPSFRVRKASCFEISSKSQFLSQALDRTTPCWPVPVILFSAAKHSGRMQLPRALQAATLLLLVAAARVQSQELGQQLPGQPPLLSTSPRFL